MSRRKVIRPLPPIEEAFTPIPSTEGIKRRKLYAHLEEACLRLRKEAPVAFYSMREVSVFFRVPLRTIALVFADLEQKNILSRLRGSRTMLMGTADSPRHPIRGVVGIPILLDGMILSPFTSQVNMLIEENLRKIGFVADLIFFSQKEEETRPEFAEKLLEHKLDIVIWQNPLPQCRQNILALRERGVRTLAILTDISGPPLPVVAYQQNFEPGYHALVKSWKEEGVKEIILPFSRRNFHSQSEPDEFIKLVLQYGLTPLPCDPLALAELANTNVERRRKKQAVAFIDLPTANLLCNQSIETGKLLGSFAKVGLCRGPLRSQNLRNLCVKPEVVAFSPHETASKLSDDIRCLSSVQDGHHHSFEARYWREGLDESPSLLL